ncbi:MAG: hypothetical protein MUC58_12630 [Rhizobiaceae bacterium]|jgi:hypothetical protein|nr:hypothetical protein [Rhizobiaceae bacterium]
MVVLALAVYWAFVRFVENRPVSGLSTTGGVPSSQWAYFLASSRIRVDFHPELSREAA